MSERMIELQRARLLAAGKGSSTAHAARNGSQASSALHRGPATSAPAPALVHQTPQQAALAATRMEDLQIQRLLQRLQQRDDSRVDIGPTASISTANGPTVPTALSRRILQRQGVGFLDPTVAAITSAAGDRFLATVLQQAIACRDQRLKGAEMAREAARHRRRHMQQYQADSDDRWRRKHEREEKRERENLAAIEAAEALNKGNANKAKDQADDETSASAAKSKKKKKPEETPVNGNKRKRDGGDDDEEASYDSIDEEEEYYRQHYGEEGSDIEEDEDEEDMLVLRDLERPAGAWGFTFSGKQGMEPEAEASEDEDDESDEGEEELLAATDVAEKGGDKSTPASPIKESHLPRADPKSPDEKPPSGRISVSPASKPTTKTGSPT